MAMLAEPKRKQKWSLNPRGKDWSDDQNKFGQKLLEKMGWSKGKGLGANEQGQTEHVRVKVKNDSGGIGFDKNQMDDAWTEHQDSFNSFLQQLQGNEESKITEASEITESLSGKSLELRSKQSRARVHYQKFTRGKDVNKYSTKDLANIFGQKNLNEKQTKKEAQKENDIIPEAIGSRTYESGVVTIYGGNMADYFKSKSPNYFKSSNKENIDRHNSSDDEGTQYRGFGFSEANETTNEVNGSSKIVKEGTNNCTFDNPQLNTNWIPESNISNAVEKTISKASQSSKKRKSDSASERNDLDLNCSEQRNVPKKLKMNAQQDCRNGGFVNGALDLESQVDETHNGSEFEVARLNCADGELIEEDRNGEPVEAANNENACTIETSKKKKKKKKSKTKEYCNGAFENIALDLESKGNGDCIGKEFEVSGVHLGISNKALDLTDESNKKKRVRFNDQVEYSTDHSNKKKKLTAKLDKFEVDNEKIKKKRKKVQAEVSKTLGIVNEALNIEVLPEEIDDNKGKIKKKRKKEQADISGTLGIVNEALDIEILSEEINDNEVNERKSKKIRKKKERRMSNLETIEEAPEEDRQTLTEVPPQIDVITLDQSLIEIADDMVDCSPEKKTKKKKKEKTKDKITVIDITREEEEEVVQHPKKKKRKRDKPADNENADSDASKSIDTSNVEADKSIEQESTESKTLKKVKKRKRLEEDVGSADKEVKSKKLKEIKNDDIEVTIVSEENANLSGKNDIKDEADVKTSASKKSKKRSKAKECTKENSNTEPEVSINESSETPTKTEYVKDVSLTEYPEDNSKSDSLVINNSWNGRMRMSKKVLKTFFHRKAILHFPGSNIHEIKGYGVDIEGTQVPCT